MVATARLGRRGFGSMAAFARAPSLRDRLAMFAQCRRHYSFESASHVAALRAAGDLRRTHQADDDPRGASVCDRPFATGTTFLHDERHTAPTTSPASAQSADGRFTSWLAFLVPACRPWTTWPQALIGHKRMNCPLYAGAPLSLWTIAFPNHPGQAATSISTFPRRLWPHGKRHFRDFFAS